MNVPPEALRRMNDDPALFFDSVVIPSSPQPQRFADACHPFQREWIAAISPSLTALTQGHPQPGVRRFFADWTKGCGKDTLATMVVLYAVMFAQRRIMIEIGAGDFGQAREVVKIARAMQSLNLWWGDRIEIQNNLIRCRANGAECEILTSDSKTAHGSRPNMVVCNELTHVDRWSFIETMLDNAGKVPDCVQILLTNAGFIDTPQWHWRENARKSPLWHFQAVGRPAPQIDKSDIEESLRRNTLARHNRLLYGMWGTGEDGALSPADVQACTTLPGPCWLRLEQWEPYILAFDLGRRRDHCGAVVLGACSTDHKFKLSNCRSWKPPRPGEPIDLEAVHIGLREFCERYQVAAAIYDPNEGGEQMAQRLGAAFPRLLLAEMPFSSPNCDLMARALLDCFVGRQIDIYDDSELARDLLQLQIAERISGYKLTAKRTAEGGHADRGVALSIGLGGAMKFGEEIIAAIEDDGASPMQVYA